MLDPKLKIAVCGGGVGGLTFALAAARHPDISVEIYEAASQFSPIGAGIGIWPRVWEILMSLGLEELAMKTSLEPTTKQVTAFKFRKSDQPEGMEFFELLTNGPFLTFHRHDFQQTLIDHLPLNCPIHYSKRLRNYIREPSGKINAMFEDGSTATCDLLIGADGIKSVVRECFLHEQADEALIGGDESAANAIRATISPTWTGTSVFRGLVPVAKVQGQIDAGTLKIPKVPTQFMGKSANMILYPVANGTMMNIAAFRTQPELADSCFEGPWVTPVDASEVLSAFSDWEIQARGWLKCIENPTRWAVHVVRPLHSFGANGVVLLGDAAHAMAPHQGSGAGQAIEDAYFLATLLGHPSITSRTLHNALTVYDSIRRPFSSEVARRSLLNGKYYTMNTGLFDLDNCSSEETLKRLQDLGSSIAKNWQWAWTTSLNGSLVDGMTMLTSLQNARAPTPLYKL